MRLAVVTLLALAALPARAQLAVGADVSLGPSLTSIGASATVEAAGVPLPLGRVDLPAAVGIDARVRLEVYGPRLGGRVGVGYLSASDVFDGASLVGQQSVDVAFAVASGEATYRQPLGGGLLVVRLGPEVRVLLDEGSPQEGLLRFVGDVRRSHLALGASVGGQWDVGGLALGPELRGGLALTPFTDDAASALDGRLRLAGEFRFNHASLGLTVGI